MTQSQLLQEIYAQPVVTSTLLAERPMIHQVAHVIRQYQPRFVMIAARGTSDNAARYAQYLFGMALGWPVALATPALGTLYNADVHLEGALVIGISQSGRSPDICDVVQRARAQGALTVAITNNPASRLAQSAAHHIDIHAGPELSVAATKSYTNQLTTLALLVAALTGDTTFDAALDELPRLFTQVLAVPQATIDAAAAVLAGAPAAMSVGRGLQYATAFEAALKIKELSGLPVEPYSSADVLHGPVTVVEAGFPVLMTSDSGATCADMAALCTRLRQQSAQLLVVSNDEHHLQQATVALPLPACDQRVAPMVAIATWQRVAHASAHVRGRNPDAPQGLTKITETR
ncbi:MAG: SIS domain-containing protein [Chloroflexi bacterium]|nr:SIS domain-containing protein [Chloroflexota bacterium]